MITRTACYIGIAAAVLDTLYPSERFEKQMKMLFSLVFLIIVAAGFAKGGISLDASIPTEAESAVYSQAEQDAYDLFIRIAENNINSHLESALRRNEIFFVNIQTSINISDNGGISINEVLIKTEDTELFEAAANIIKAELADDNAVIMMY